MAERITGIHHVTAIADDPQRNVDFYADVLGLRMVKQTVNFDDPGTYHLYFGDDLGRPGSILTFFPWLGIRQGTSGSGLTSAVSLAIPAGALAYWQERLDSYGIRHGDPTLRFDEQVIPLYDSSGLLLELVTQPESEALPAWTGGGVPAAYAIRHIAGVTLTYNHYQPTAALLVDGLGFTHTGSEGNRLRYVAADGSTSVDILHRPDVPYGTMGAGSVHHIAWRTPDDEQQQAWQRALGRQGLGVTPVQDRQYFHSIYFREPGGVLFEIATDPPGFTIDEAPEQLGSRLMLPPWLEGQRSAIERRLPPLTLPGSPQQAVVQEQEG